MQNLTTRVVVEHIQGYLGGCSQKVICRYLGVTTVALSQNIEKPFTEILENKVGSRLDSLLFLLECVKHDQTIDASLLHRLLTLPAYKGKDGWEIDVVSAIHEDYPPKKLVEIFQRAVEVLRKPFEQTPVQYGLYREIHAKQA